jgi:hypothetical protein
VQDYAQHKVEKGEPVPDMMTQPVTRVRPSLKMKSHFRREGFWMYVYQFGPMLVALVVVIIVQTVRGALRPHALRAVSSSAVRAGP